MGTYPDTLEGNDMSGVEQKFSGRGLKRGGTLFLGPDVALELINEAERRGVRILGLDAFLIRPAESAPILEHSVDFSPSPDNVGSWGEARTHVSTRAGLGLQFEVALDE
jgi:hypothetical protein